MKLVKNNWVFIIVIMICLFTIACEKEMKKGKVAVIDQEFVIRQDSEFAYVIDGKGTIKNVGEVDVKNIVVSGSCSSCGDTLTAGAWMISPDIDKTKEQKDIINYLSPGSEETFSFKGVAYMYNKVPEVPENIPEDLEVKIISFESMDKL